MAMEAPGTRIPQDHAGCIGALAAMAALSGQQQEAARLLGAAKKLRKSIDIATERFEAEIEQATLSSLWLPSDG